MLQMKREAKSAYVLDRKAPIYKSLRSLTKGPAGVMPHTFRQRCYPCFAQCLIGPTEISMKASDAGQRAWSIRIVLMCFVKVVLCEVIVAMHENPTQVLITGIIVFIECD